MTDLTTTAERVADFSATFDERARFLVDLARRLHLAGVSASRLEGAVISTAQAIQLSCQIWSAPTGILLSLGEDRKSVV